MSTIVDKAARMPAITPERLADTSDMRLSDVESVIWPHFDVSYYVAANPDVCADGVAALRHFIAKGAAERRRPTAWFDVTYYLNAHPDVEKAGVNPFWHYIVAGAREGRRPSRAGGHRREVLDHVVDPRIRTRDYPRPPRPRLLAVAALTDMLQVAGHGRHMVLSISHDLYLRSTGGIQLFIADEQRAFLAQATDYLHISPFYPDLVLAEPAVEQVLTVVLNNRLLGQIENGALTATLRAHAGVCSATTLVVHSLLGHDSARVVEWQRALGSRKNVFWLHDYASVCSGFHLLRNDVVFCYAPPSHSQACRVCIYGEQRRREADRYRRLFAQIPFTVAAPSHAALAIWSDASQLPACATVVHPHCELLPDPVTLSARADGPVRIAFVGFPSAHKGWPLFLALLALPGVLYKYSFFHFAVENAFAETPPAVTRVTARTSSTHRTAMTDALAANAIDLVLLASPWPETFSYALFESLAAGADVLTVSTSGNIADTVLALGRGIVAEDDAALVAMVASGLGSAYAHLCREAGTPRSMLRHCGTTATLAEAA